MYIYQIKFKGKGSVVAENEEKALQKMKEQLKGTDIEYLDLVGKDQTITRPDQLIEEMEMMVNMTKTAYEFNSSFGYQYTDYANGYDKGYLTGMRDMLTQMKGLVYGNKNE